MMRNWALLGLMALSTVRHVLLSLFVETAVPRSRIIRA